MNIVDKGLSNEKVIIIPKRTIPLSVYFDTYPDLNKYMMSIGEVKQIVKRRNTFIKIVEIYENERYFYVEIEGQLFNEFFEEIKEAIRAFYEKMEVHIIRYLRSNVLLIKEFGKLRAIKATPISSQEKSRVIGFIDKNKVYASDIIKAIRRENSEFHNKALCELINNDINENCFYNSVETCEKTELFFASIIIDSAFEKKLIDACVSVDYHLGTIIKSDGEADTQNIPGVLYTSPSKGEIEYAQKEGVELVFPYTAGVQQLRGIKSAIEKGYSNILVTFNYSDNYMHGFVDNFELRYGVKIYKLALCHSGVDKETANILFHNADILFSYDRVYALTSRGWYLINNCSKKTDIVKRLEKQ